jgi:hypothetical protein
MQDQHVADASYIYLIPLYILELISKSLQYSYILLEFLSFLIVMTIFYGLWIWHDRNMDTNSQFCLRRVATS